MEVVIPHLTLPAKVDPVARRVSLMLNFNGVFKTGIRKLLLNKMDNSYDDRVLRDSNALVGAPVDVIVHQRKLQASEKWSAKQIL